MKLSADLSIIKPLRGCSLKLRFMIILLGVFGAITTKAQPSLREDFLPASGTFEQGSLAFSYSLGDLAIQNANFGYSILVNGTQYDLEIITALEDHDPKMYVFPNPTSDLIHLEYKIDSESPFQLRIYDMRGVLFYRKDFVFDAEYQLKLDLNDLKLSVGLYLMEVQQGTDVQLFKVIKI